HNVRGDEPAAAFSGDRLAGPPVDISCDARGLERRERAEERPADTGEHVAGPPDRHPGVAGAVEPHTVAVRDDVDMPFEEDSPADARASRSAGATGGVVREPGPSDPLELAGMRGVDGLALRNRQREPEGV